MKTKARIALLIPTLNAGERWKAVLESIAQQSISGLKKIIVDSGSVDETVVLAIKQGFEVIRIKVSEFNHGGTRQLLVKASGADIAIFLTQDAILASPDSIVKLLDVFSIHDVSVAYGRQLPQLGATAIESHARLFNYPQISQLRSYEDKERVGFKVFFCSNSFAAYRIDVLNSIGGFPTDSIMGEDALTAAKMLSKGYKIAYVAAATVYHSHHYTLRQEFRRYFDTRVFHEQNPWLIDEYGKPGGEGLRFVKSELRYVLRNDVRSLFKSIASLAAKWLGYKTGKYYKRLSPALLSKLSMHSSY